MKAETIKTIGYVIIGRASARHKWRIAYDALFSSKKSAEAFAEGYELGGMTKVVSGSISANLLF